MLKRLLPDVTSALFEKYLPLKYTVSMPNGFEHTESLSCARPSTRNYGLCPGDSGNTVGKA